MKLNNKGFTLIELIATIAIITLLTIIVAPSVINSLNSGKNKSYEILVANIVTASKELYEEVYSNELLGVSTTLYENSTEISIDEDDSITINLQTLVNNGFLSGTNKDETKIVTNPKENNGDIGNCKIKITRDNDNGKVTYTIENLSKDNKCPTTDDYKKGVK